MDIQKIKQLIDVLAASDLAELELIEGGDKVRLVKRLRADAAVRPQQAPCLEPLASHAAPASGAAQSSPPNQAQQAPQAGAEQCITAPLYGVMHLTPSPDAATFVKLGDTVAPGQTLCVIEAMKMFHEVKAGRTGVVRAIVATAGQEVEAGAVLFELANAP